MQRNKSPLAPFTTQHDTQQQTDNSYTINDESTDATDVTHAISKISQQVLRYIEHLVRKRFEKVRIMFEKKIIEPESLSLDRTKTILNHESETTIVAAVFLYNLQ